MQQLRIGREEDGDRLGVDVVERDDGALLDKASSEGRWYQSVSADVIPWRKASTVRVLQSATRMLVAVERDHRRSRRQWAGLVVPVRLNPQAGAGSVEP